MLLSVKNLICVMSLLFGVCGNSWSNNIDPAIISITNNIFDKRSLSTNSTPLVLDTLSNFPTSTIVALANEIFLGSEPNPFGPGLTVKGAISCMSDVMTIALPNYIFDLIINDGPVVIQVPTSGALVITVHGVVYSGSVPGLVVETTATANTFHINKSLTVLAQSNGVYINIDSASTLHVDGDIHFDGNNLKNTSFINVGSICNAGVIVTSGDITMSNNSGGLTLAGIENTGTIETSSGNIIMNYNVGGANNVNTGAGAGIGGSGGTNSSAGSIIADSGSVTLNYNVGGSSLGTGAGAGAGVGGGGGNARSMSHNGGAGSLISAVSGNISNNTGGGTGSQGGGGGAGFGGGGGGNWYGGQGGDGATYSSVITIGSNTGGTATEATSGEGNGQGGDGGGDGAPGGIGYTAV